MRLCTRCRVNPKPPRKHYCETCSKLCPQCLVNEKGINMGYCYACWNEYYRDRRSAKQPRLPKPVPLPRQPAPPKPYPHDKKMAELAKLCHPDDVESVIRQYKAKHGL